MKGISVGIAHGLHSRRLGALPASAPGQGKAGRRWDVRTILADLTASRSTALKGLFSDTFADGNLEVAKLREARGEVAAFMDERHTTGRAYRTVVAEPPRRLVAPHPTCECDILARLPIRPAPMAEADPAAVLAAHRPYLRRIAGVRFDDRLRGRVDESDLVQDALTEAARGYAAFAEAPPMPLRLWLRQLLLDALTAARRRHLIADARAAGREVDLSAGSFVWAEPQFHTPDPTPGSEAGRRERAELVRLAVARLDPADSEVIALRTFEGLSTTEAAEVLGISPAATSKRLVRALAKLKAELKPFDPMGSGP
jgi:RNA polymerase sigma-70 factor (ECF subfamily)